MFASARGFGHSRHKQSDPHPQGLFEIKERDANFNKVREDIYCLISKICRRNIVNLRDVGDEVGKPCCLVMLKTLKVELVTWHLAEPPRSNNGNSKAIILDCNAWQ